MGRQTNSGGKRRNEQRSGDSEQPLAVAGRWGSDGFYLQYERRQEGCDADIRNVLTGFRVT